MICYFLIHRDKLISLGDVLNMRWKLRITSGHGRVGKLQARQLVRNVTIGEGLDDNGPVNEHSVGHVQGGGQHVVVHELDEADPGLDVDAGIPEAGVQPDVLDLAEEAEQGVHLIPGGLGGDVGHLDHPGLLLHPQNTICQLLLASPFLK